MSNYDIPRNYHRNEETHINFMMESIYKDFQNEPHELHHMFPIIISVDSKPPIHGEPNSYPLQELFSYIIRELKDESEDKRLDKNTPFNREMILYIPKGSNEDHISEILLFHHFYDWNSRRNSFFIYDPGFERGEFLNKKYNEIIRYARCFEEID